MTRAQDTGPFRSVGRPVSSFVGSLNSDWKSVRTSPHGPGRSTGRGSNLHSNSVTQWSCPRTTLLRRSSTVLSHAWKAAYEAPRLPALRRCLSRPQSASFACRSSRYRQDRPVDPDLAGAAGNGRSPVSSPRSVPEQPEDVNLGSSTPRVGARNRIPGCRRRCSQAEEAAPVGKRPSWRDSAPPALCHPDRRTEARGLCLQCYMEWHKEHVQDDEWRERRQRYMQQYHQRDGKSPADYYKSRGRVSYIKRTYGLTVAEYEECFRRAGYQCQLCPRDARVLDHCHTTGRVRGVLCTQCNAALNRADEDIDWLDRVRVYLQSDRGDS